MDGTTPQYVVAGESSLLPRRISSRLIPATARCCKFCARRHGDESHDSAHAATGEKRTPRGRSASAAATMHSLLGAARRTVENFMCGSNTRSRSCRRILSTACTNCCRLPDKHLIAHGHSRLASKGAQRRVVSALSRHWQNAGRPATYSRDTSTPASGNGGQLYRGRSARTTFAGNGGGAEANPGGDPGQPEPSALVGAIRGSFP
jgi:hypothetical protein